MQGVTNKTDEAKWARWRAVANLYHAFFTGLILTVVTRRGVPAAVPGIVFLSGGQSDVAATERLNAICAAGGAPWTLTFSFGRALQDAALKTWKGSPANVVAAQTALLHRAKCNALAVQGKYSADVERAAV